MRILYFHQHFSTRAGSTGTRSYEFARRLKQRGHHVTIVCGAYQMADAGLNYLPVHGGIRRGLVDGIDVIELAIPYSNYDSLPLRAWKFLRFAIKSVALAFKEPHDLLFATTTPLTAGIPGIVRKLLGYRQPFVFEVRDLWPELPKAMGVLTNPFIIGALSVLEWASYRAADAAVGLSPGIVEGIRRRSREGQRIALIPNGCDLDLFRSSRSSREDSSLRDIQPKDLLAVFTGAHGIANGLDSVLDAAAVLNHRGRADIKILFVGDGKTKPALVARAKSEGLNNCIFIDPVPKVRLAEIMGRADVGLMILKDVPSFYYGTSPNKFFDYLALGLPILTNYPGWVADLVNENQCGCVVPSGNAGAFASALAVLADSPAERVSMGLNARRLGESEFDRTSLADRFVDYLESCSVESRFSTKKQKVLPC